MLGQNELIHFQPHSLLNKYLDYMSMHSNYYSLGKFQKQINLNTNKVHMKRIHEIVHLLSSVLTT